MDRVRINATTDDDKARRLPTLRSMPAVMITKVMARE
jgi:hypothetical protein